MSANFILFISEPGQSLLYDLDNEVNENKEDNYVLVPVVKKKALANISINTGYSKICDLKKTAINFEGDDDSLFFNCDICLDTIKNLYSEINDISLTLISDNDYDINVTVHSTNIDNHSTASYTFNLNLDSASAINIYLDEANEFTEDK